MQLGIEQAMWILDLVLNELTKVTSLIGGESQDDCLWYLCQLVKSQGTKDFRWDGMEMSSVKISKCTWTDVLDGGHWEGGSLLSGECIQGGDLLGVRIQCFI